MQIHLAIKNITEKEMRGVVLRIKGERLPGSCGYGNRFLETSWHIVGRESHFARIKLLH